MGMAGSRSLNRWEVGIDSPDSHHKGCNFDRVDCRDSAGQS
jgi:hypothetical protein